MKLAIVGQDQLAQTTKACCQAAHFDIYHPAEADVLWVCYDTPLDSQDTPDVDWVLRHIRRDLTSLPTDAYVVISSPLPVGTTARLEHEYPYRRFACVPENIRVASGIKDFTHQARIVVGRRHHTHDWWLATLLDPFTTHMIWTDPETAELCKHALNAYLALSIAYINEISRIARMVGADMATVTDALLTEPRISPTAPLHAGKPYGGGHLGRDVGVLNSLIHTHNLYAPVLAHITQSNANAGS